MKIKIDKKTSYEFSGYELTINTKILTHEVFQYIVDEIYDPISNIRINSKVIESIGQIDISDEALYCGSYPSLDLSDNGIECLDNIVFPEKIKII